MASFWHWLGDNWVGAVNSLISAFIGGVVSRLLPTHQERKEERKASEERAVDAKVIQTMSDRRLWGSADIAKAQSLDREEIISGLDRLIARGRVKCLGQTTNLPPTYLLDR